MTCPSRFDLARPPGTGCCQRLDDITKIITAESLAVHKGDRPPVGLRVRRDVHIRHHDRLHVISERKEANRK
jgi:hypothetical protein